MQSVIAMALSRSFVVAVLSAAVGFAAPLRLIAVGHRQNMSASVSYETWAQQFNTTELYNARYSSQDPVIISFGEMTGLSTAFIGSRGVAARNSSTIADAFILLGVDYAMQAASYLEKFPSIEPVNGIELALSDVMWRAFFSTFSALSVYLDAYIISATIGPYIVASTDPADIAFYGDPDLSPNQTIVYLPAGPDVMNLAYMFSPNGSIIHSTPKKHLTQPEVSLLNLTPGNLSDNTVASINVGKVCVAICWDGFFVDVLRHLDGQGCEILIQPSYNMNIWAGNISNSSVWQPLDWTSGPFGGLQSSRTANVSFWVNPMVTGNLLDQMVDGQSSIVSRVSSKLPPPVAALYVGMIPENIQSPPYNYTGVCVLGLSEWAFADPIHLPLPQRRAHLAELAQLLLPGSGSPFEGLYAATMIFADINNRDPP
jgi:hypothetical protein